MSETPGLSFAYLGGVGNGGWRGAFRVARRQALLRGECPGEVGGGLPGEAGVGAFGVVVMAPGGQRDAGMVQGREQGLVQQRSRCPLAVCPRTARGRWFGIAGSTIGDRMPIARLRPPRRRTCSCSSR